MEMDSEPPRGRARILVVDDDQTSCSALADLLRGEGYEVLPASDGTSALRGLATFEPDLVISDLSMPHLGGFGLVQCIREGHASTADVPIILISSHLDTSNRVHGFQFGADDFLPKPVQIDELLARVERHLGRARKQRETTRLSVSDELTGMLNRRGIRNSFARAQEEYGRGAQPISVLLVDVTRFKAINDKYGHAVGDMALCAVARTLQDSVRASDRVGRVGGDEFLIVLPGADQLACDQLKARLREALPIRLRLTEDERISISFAIGSATSAAGEALETLIARADRAMYADKHASAAHGTDDASHTTR